jgi:hypothetical protein
MAVYVVTWDLNNEKPNYAAARDAFISHIDRYEHIKDTRLDSVRFISTNWSPTQVREDLQLKLDNNDHLFLCQINRGQNDGYLDKSVWAWIHART